jgi:hypothetical protein
VQKRKEWIGLDLNRRFSRRGIDPNETVHTKVECASADCSLNSGAEDMQQRLSVSIRLSGALEHEGLGRRKGET